MDIIDCVEYWRLNFGDWLVKVKQGKVRGGGGLQITSQAIGPCV